MRATERRDATTYGAADEETAFLSPRQKFSWRIVTVLIIYVSIINGCSELICPFINHLILKTGIAPNESSVGFYSGLIETVASCFSFAALIPGSIAADRWGRKPVLCSTLIGTAIGLSFFGVGNTLPALVIFRSIGYALGPILGWSTVVTILGDISSPSNRGIAFSAANASYRIGQLFSPVFTSAFAHPRARYSWFQSDFWVRHPYALPCWVGAAMCIATLYIIICYIPETAPNLYPPTSRKILEEGYGTIDAHNKCLLSASIMADDAASLPLTPVSTGTTARDAAPQFRTGLFTPYIIQLLISAWIMCFINSAMISLFLLWAFTPISNGGLGAPEATIGMYISARAIAHLLGLIPFAYFERRLGVYRLYACCMTIFAVAGTSYFPLLNMLVKSYGINSPYFNLAMFLFFIVGGFANYCATCIVMMINQAAPAPQALARLIGVSQSVMTLGQCMSPLITSTLFQFSIKSNLLGGNLIWAFLISISLVASVHSFTLRASP